MNTSAKVTDYSEAELKDALLNSYRMRDNLRNQLQAQETNIVVIETELERRRVEAEKAEKEKIPTPEIASNPKARDTKVTQPPTETTQK